MLLTRLRLSAIRQCSRIPARIHPYALESRTFTSKASPVDLEYDKLVPQNGNETEGALVILHGLLYV